jgi:DNA-binding NarL/FixJ family response regulator
MRTIRVGIFDEHEIFRRGIEACLRDDPRLQVITERPEGARDDLDVAVVSPRAASATAFGCPVVLCGGEESTNAEQLAAGNTAFAVFPRGTVTPEQLIAAVHAAAAGLRILSEPGHPESTISWRLDERCLKVLRLLGEGADTREIGQQLSYSDRTIKSVIHDLQRALGARSRAHAVAEAVRQGLI